VGGLLLSSAPALRRTRISSVSNHASSTPRGRFSPGRPRPLPTTATGTTSTMVKELRTRWLAASGQPRRGRVPRAGSRCQTRLTYRHHGGGGRKPRLTWTLLGGLVEPHQRRRVVPCVPGARRGRDRHHGPVTPPREREQPCAPSSSTRPTTSPATAGAPTGTRQRRRLVSAGCGQRGPDRARVRVRLETALCDYAGAVTTALARHGLLART
jgi:hypothetical protein